jgi:hypothetical protein
MPQGIDFGFQGAGVNIVIQVDPPLCWILLGLWALREIMLWNYGSCFPYLL